MNHFTPFLPVEALLSTARISDERSGDLENRVLQATLMREQTQRRAVALLLLVTGFVFTFCFVAKV